MSESAPDTIAAIATATGEGAVAIVRVSGSESLAIADRIFTGKGPLPSQRPPNTFLHGVVQSGETVADEVILLIYRAPHSYTREDAIEIQGHGGMAAAQRTLRAVLDAGARLAEPGEFTKRAFLNGRIDLLQAEGVLDLIRSKTDRAASAALEQMNGLLSHSFNSLYDSTLMLAAKIESTLDFPEDELPEELTGDLINDLASVQIQFKTLLASWDEGHLLRDGALVVIAGKPNSGKSTLLNALLGTDRAIVTPIAGTTRDTIEEQVVINGYLVRLVDTAGLRDTLCAIESEGISRAKKHINQADLIIYVVDATRPFDGEDERNLSSFSQAKTLVALNKCEIKPPATNASQATISPHIFISAKERIGIDELKERIAAMVGAKEAPPYHALISERHRRLLVSAHKDLTEATRLLQRQLPEPALAASRLRGALETLGEATGRIYHDELLNTIFSRFCIGK